MNPTRTEHELSPKDAATVEAIRQQSTPFKGTMTGPEARPGYDAIIEAVPWAEAVSYEEAVLGGVAGMWCRPPSARRDAAIAEGKPSARSEVALGVEPFRAALRGQASHSGSTSARPAS